MRAKINRRLMMISPKLRKRFYYKVPEAGAKIGLKRTESYEAARLGVIPIERDGKLMLVPREPWDREVRSLMK